jgi:hypothetical protein
MDSIRRVNRAFCYLMPVNFGGPIHYLFECMIGVYESFRLNISESHSSYRFIPLVTCMSCAFLPRKLSII